MNNNNNNNNNNNKKNNPLPYNTSKECLGQ